MNIFLSAKSDRKAVAALAKCRTSENGDLAQLFRQLLDETKTALMTADGDNFRRLQGKAKVLADFVEAVEEAPRILERMK